MLETRAAVRREHAHISEAPVTHHHLQQLPARLAVRRVVCQVGHLAYVGMVIKESFVEHAQPRGALALHACAQIERV